MGTQAVSERGDGDSRRRFQKRVLGDLLALERMLDQGAFESGVRRIGAEQELSLVGPDREPAPVADRVIEAVGDPHVVCELARFNLEINCDPLVLGGECFSRLHQDLDRALAQVRLAALRENAEPILVGIVPTIAIEHLGLENLTPRPRYFELNRRLTELRGGAHALHLRGVDDLSVRHDSIMLESVNTSFQVHLQVTPDEFATAYNVAQLVAAPLLAASGNSPLLLGRRLWHETRIAVFVQSIDTRRPEDQRRDEAARVRFGEGWVDSILDLYREDLSRLRSLCLDESHEDALAELAAGRVPRLRALGMHNSTVYRWNRACYGVTDGVPHLRIENRVLAAGPSVRDEVANAAFWVGMVLGGIRRWGDVRTSVHFEDVASNFVAAARVGLATRFRWLDGSFVAADRLILDDLIPVAREGLIDAGVNGADAEACLQVIVDRVTSGHTGSQWTLSSLRNMTRGRPFAGHLAAIADSTITMQASGEPVSRWPLAPACASRVSNPTKARAGQVMSPALITVRPDDLARMAFEMMTWRNIHHIMVEDDDHRLIGVVLRSDLEQNDPRDRAVADVMRQGVPTVDPATSLSEAAARVGQSGLSCVAVLCDERLQGVLTRVDIEALGLGTSSAGGHGAV
ncbi:MAG: CBS domain-containing protein [Phycisphaeraceae bacterium]|nr:CBS domain-containing protein [Phycisphaeraceae bacterium]